MNGETVPSAVRAFIAEHIRSVVELECLLLLHQDAAREWSAAELAHQLRIDEQWTIRQLADLTQRGFVAATEASPPCYRYAPQMPALAESVQQLAIYYAERRVSVIEIIYAKPAEPLQSFADAFRFRKDPPHG